MPHQKDLNAFWAEQAERIDWIEPWNRVSHWSFERPVHIEWFSGAKLNLAVNCLDRHLTEFGDKTAIIWEPDHPQTPGRKLTFRELHDQVGRMANVLREQGVSKGDFVTLYMPMIPEAAIAMLACARIGAPHSVVFGGFSPDSLADRMNDCKSRILITADHGWRGGKVIPLKHNVENALAKVPSVERVLVVRHPLAVPPDHSPAPVHPTRDVDLLAAMALASPQCAAEAMDAEDPLFILYTSGSTGKPKGVLHTTGGYAVFAAYTHATIFDTHGTTRPSDVYWCTADVGWVTGHSYLVYGPLLNGVTTVLFEGVPHYPTPSRFWEVIDRHQVTLFYTAPTAIRALMREGDSHVTSSSRASLRILGSVGEPINPEAWNWYHRVVGGSRCPVVDTWWQTETGGILISPIPGKTPLKAGSATLPLPTVSPCLVDDKGHILRGAVSGNLCLTQSWPGQMRTIYGDHARFEQTYFSTYPGKYFTGDGARRDEDGYYWITGRVDDVINVSGHRLGTAEIESALVSHPAVAEAAVVGFPHEIKGQGVYAYVVLRTGQTADDSLSKALIQHVRAQIGALAQPDVIHWALTGLPKTRSGKIMRRILRKIAENELGALGDISTLADPSVVEALALGRKP